jgi:hypothetical protein
LIGGLLMTKVSSTRRCLECNRIKIFRRFCIFCLKNTTTNVCISIQEKISIRETFKLRKKRKGFAKFVYELIQGWFPSGDERIKDGVNKKRIIDKENNRYFEHVEDNHSKKVIHHREEKLTDHRR